MFLVTLKLIYSIIENFFNKDRFDEKIRHCRDMGSTPMEIKSNHAVIASYLGVEESNATF